MSLRAGYNPPFAKARSRYNLPGRMTDALAAAMNASHVAVANDTAILSKMITTGHSVAAPGLQGHLQQVDQMNPKDIARRAVALGYNDLVTSAIPSEHDAGVSVAALAAGANGELVQQKKKRTRKPKSVMGVPIAEVAPAGDVVLASVVSDSDSLRTVAGPSFCAFMEDYAKSKAHSKTESLHDYLQKQMAAGKRWNGATRRFVQSGEKKPRKKKASAE